MKFLCDAGINTIELEEHIFLKSYNLIKSENEELANWLWNKRSISYSRLWEIALAGLKKGVKWTDIEGMDHSDGTEVKTARLNLANDGTYSCTIKNLQKKTGNIKIILYDTIRNQFLFLFLSNKHKNENIIESERGTLRISLPRTGRKPRGWWIDHVVPFEKFIKL